MGELLLSEMTYDDYLAHFGVKGMKWGVRKSENRSGSSRQNGSKTPSSSSGESKTTKQKVKSKNFDRDYVLQSLMTKQAKGVDLLKPANLTRRERGRLDEAIYKHGMKSKNNKVALGLAMNVEFNQPNGYDVSKAHGLGKRRHTKKG